MEFEIDESIINWATECEKGFRCLSGDADLLCKVDISIQDKVIFITCSNTKPCSYQMKFGYSVICNCPVRKEIYRRYKR